MSWVDSATKVLIHDRRQKLPDDVVELAIDLFGIGYELCGENWPMTAELASIELAVGCAGTDDCPEKYKRFVK